MNIWIVSREYAGIAEAGGVKNVSRSLSEGLVEAGHKVLLFMPLYDCTDLSEVKNFTCFWHYPVRITVDHKEIPVSFSHGIINGVEVVFIGNKVFSSKKAVYTYTQEEESLNPEFKHGTGHKDSQYMNTLFQKAVIEYGKTCASSEAPEIIHSQDATAALVPAFMEYAKKNDLFFNEFFHNTKCVVTIHNAGPGYHHQFDSLEEAEFHTSLDGSFLSAGKNQWNQIEPFILCSALKASITTVSPQYAQEILTETTDTAGLSKEFIKYGTNITGITNGIDFDSYEPSDTKKSLLPFTYNPLDRNFDGKYANRRFFVENFCAEENQEKKAEELTQYGWLEKNSSSKDAVIFTYHGRVVSQKGIEVLAVAAEEILSKYKNVYFVFAGQGQNEIENHLAEIARRNPGKCVYLKGYNKLNSRLSIAAADFSIHPSHFEPCGLEDFIAQILGTVPIAHATGGLCKIIDGKTGFLYSPNNPESIVKKISSIIDRINCEGKDFIIETAKTADEWIRNNYSWKTVTEKYLNEIYKK